ncbi:MULTISPECIES: class F sortase [unclassified Streptomyces]|uniref:class F sortase n=1 Tax=unclassified Streptomyces TaxID=2593676 RepID=UPI00081E3A62|nr:MULTISPECIES: class F sortase [unclassified Streptomyces]MYR97696.1 class F sortase [Streptomyces sp. SID4937]SCE28780.1 Sortase (surface protein transpeptidase) [Streptomyces sp. ScaeMP-e83]
MHVRTFSHRPHRAHRSRPAARPAALLAALVTCAALTACAGPEPSSATSPPTASAPASSAPAPTATDEPPASAPTEVTIPSLKIRSSLMRLGLNADGTVEVPPAEKGMTAGWYSGGPAPGAPGPAVLIGHNDTRFGRAVFHDLKDIRKGAEVLVRGGDGKSLRFTVTGKETVSKQAFPTERVYGATKGSTLRLVTCDGAFDAEGHPVDNLIVYAEPG